MSEDLKVDFWALEDSETTLAALKSEFDGIKDHNDENSSIWGHSSVADAMSEFAGNMDHNREKLSEEIEVTGQKMGDTLAAFRDTDAELAASFDEERAS